MKNEKIKGKCDRNTHIDFKEDDIDGLVFETDNREEKRICLC